MCMGKRAAALALSTYIYLLVVLPSLEAVCAPAVWRYLMPCLYSSCERNEERRGNSLPQMPQAYCIFSACAWALTLWQTRFDIWLKPLPHNSHLYGRSFVCVKMWLRKLPAQNLYIAQVIKLHKIVEAVLSSSLRRSSTTGGGLKYQVKGLVVLWD